MSIGSFIVGALLDLEGGHFVLLVVISLFFLVPAAAALLLTETRIKKLS